PFSGSFEVPADTPLGDYRMRVRAQWGNSDPLPCGDISWGEAEDYTFTVITPPACMPPSGLAVSGVTFNSADLIWTSSGDLFDIEWGTQGFTLGEGVLVIGVANPHTLTGLTAETNYQYYVRQDCGVDGVSLWAGPYSFYTGYCQVSSTWTGNRIEGFSTSEGYTNINNLNN